MRVKQLVVMIGMGLFLCVSGANAQIQWDLNTGTGDVNAPQNDAYSLDFVNTQGGIIVGDKLFSNFDLFSTAGAPLISQVSLRGLMDVDGNVGVEFVGNWSAFPFDSVDSNLTFKVTVLDPDYLIDGVRLYSNAMGSANGGQVSVLESIFADQPGANVDPIVDPGLIYHLSNLNVNLNTTDLILGNGYSELWVRKDIALFGGSQIDPLSHAHLSHFAQTFIQSPEPASLVLFGAGLLVLARRPRRA